MQRLIYSTIFILVLSMVSFAGDNNEGKIYGYMIGDYFYVVQNHNSSLEEQNGFWFRRIYLGYDKTLSENYSMRLRFEMNSSGDFTTSSAMSPNVKDAYLKWKKDSHSIIGGVSGTPTWELVEDFWGYRSVEKTPLDLQKYGSSRDFGVAFKGKFSDGMIGYHLMFGNGNSAKSETNKGKKVMLSINFKPIEMLVVEAYGDWNAKPGDADEYTIQGFAGIKTGITKIGLQFAQHTRQAVGDDLKLKLASVFAIFDVNEKMNVFGRVDRMLDPNPNGNKISYIPFDNTAKSTFFVGGLDYLAAKNIHFIPNVEFVKYDENDAGVTPDNDLIARFTTYFKF